MLKNKYYDALKSFIESNPNDWKEKLKQRPFNLKTVRQVDYNKNWYMLVYNLFASDFDINDSSEKDVDVIKACRGCIVDVSDINDVKIVCAPYTKFFNIGEPFVDEIDWSSAKVYDKIDGILIKAFKHNNIVYWATNGGSDPDQKMQDIISAESLNEIETKNAKTYFDLLKYALNKETPEIEIFSEAIEGTTGHKVTSSGGWCDKIPNGATVMLELVSPRNRIICKYSETKLYFHGYRDENFEEQSPIEIAEKYNIPYSRPTEYNLQNEDELNEYLSGIDGSKQEGCVVVDKYWRRAKVKCPSYLKIKFVKKDDIFSKNELFNCVIDKSFDDVIGYFPETKQYIDDILTRIHALKENVKDYADIAIQKFNELGRNRKAFAEYVLKEKTSLKSSFWFEAIKDNFNVDTYLNKHFLKKDKYEDFEKFFYIVYNELGARS